MENIEKLNPHLDPITNETVDENDMTKTVSANPNLSNLDNYVNAKSDNKGSIRGSEQILTDNPSNSPLLKNKTLRI